MSKHKLIISFKENGEYRTAEVDRLEVLDKDGCKFTIKQDVERGIEINGSTLEGKLYVEPHMSNEVTLLIK